MNGSFQVFGSKRSRNGRFEGAILFAAAAIFCMSSLGEETRLRCLFLVLLIGAALFAGNFFVTRSARVRFSPKGVCRYLLLPFLRRTVLPWNEIRVCACLPLGEAEGESFICLSSDPAEIARLREKRNLPRLSYTLAHTVFFSPTDAALAALEPYLPAEFRETLWKPMD